jgi:hypothetical protein
MNDEGLMTNDERMTNDEKPFESLVCNLFVI